MTGVSLPMPDLVVCARARIPNFAGLKFSNPDQLMFQLCLNAEGGPHEVFWGSDDGNISGAQRFHGLVGAVTIVHAAFATVLAKAPRREGTLGKLTLGPIQKALEAAMT